MTFLLTFFLVFVFFMTDSITDVSLFSHPEELDEMDDDDEGTAEPPEVPKVPKHLS